MAQMDVAVLRQQTVKKANEALQVDRSQETVAADEEDSEESEEEDEGQGSQTGQEGVCVCACACLFSPVAGGDAWE